MRKRKNNRKIKKDNIFILILVIVLLALIVSLVFMAKGILKKNKVVVQETQIVDKMDDYGYFLTDRNTDYYNSLYEELKSVLEADTVDEEKYAKLVAQLFTVDFYDLNSKISKSDVGGTQFIAQDYRDVFIKTASDIDGIYYYVKSDLYGDRKQDLPAVTKAEVVSLKNTTFKHDKVIDNKAYVVNINLTYEKELGYQKSVSLTLVHNGKKLEIVEVK